MGAKPRVGRSRAPLIQVGGLPAGTETRFIGTITATHPPGWRLFVDGVERIVPCDVDGEVVTMRPPIDDTLKETFTICDFDESDSMPTNAPDTDILKLAVRYPDRDPNPQRKR
jgi:hypothetical protein